ncbi:coniferyl aldehyde dehydrogenase [Vibrio maerlii]|uniref:coniferyl aldehyde dehydrogenase n=1 Tax=Vibrio maerlii TaxID=2231648 RepID=UPI000E3E47B8|nr:coniferyl aldehyde dehydrogenase [Vibrio maerlii]
MSMNKTSAERLESIFAVQKSYFAQNTSPTIEQRKADLTKLKALILDYKDQIIAAASEDFGHRAQNDTLIADIGPSLQFVNYSLKNLKSWMKPSKRHAGLMLTPAKVEVHYQPKGVIGIIVPWNFPIGLALVPLITAISAGNTAMLKMSEFTPAVNRVLREMLAKGFEEKQVSIIEGEVEIASRFSELSFDHIVFTGSTMVGKHVMKAASKNLTPVTLELGGKSPTVIDPDFDITDAVERILYSKSLNAGQICVAPDYVLLPRNKVNEFIQAYKAYFKKLYPQGLASKDYSSVINQRQYARLKSVVEDAKAKGAQIHTIDSTSFDDAQHRMTPHIITDTTEDMLVLQEELFGPVLPVIPYDDISDALEYINARPRPLALYLMSHNSTIQNSVIHQTHSGGVCINDSLVHVAAEDAPFGGIGPSGTGHYHGEEGFKSLSHAKTVLTRGKYNFTKLMHPPYNGFIKRMVLKVMTK